MSTTYGKNMHVQEKNHKTPLEFKTRIQVNQCSSNPPMYSGLSAGHLCKKSSSCRTMFLGKCFLKMASSVRGDSPVRASNNITLFLMNVEICISITNKPQNL